MKKKILLSVLSLGVAASISFAACTTTDSASTKNPLSTAKDVYGVGAVSSVKLLGNAMSAGAVKTLSKVSSYALNSKRQGQTTSTPITEEQIAKFNEYFNALNTFLGEDVISTSTTENTDTNYNYQTKLTINGRNFDGEKVTYVMYYTETLVSSTDQTPQPDSSQDQQPSTTKSTASYSLTHGNSHGKNNHDYYDHGNNGNNNSHTHNSNCNYGKNCGQNGTAHEHNENCGYGQNCVQNGTAHVHNADCDYGNNCTVTTKKGGVQTNKTQTVYVLEGVMVVDGKDYYLQGGRTVETKANESESELEICAYADINDKTNYISMSQETEVENNENETEYVYSIYADGKLVEQTAVEFENEVKANKVETSYELQFRNGTQVDRYKVKKEVQNNVVTIKVNYSIGNNSGVFHVREVVDENGQKQYSYQFNNGSQRLLGCHGHGNK